jgi:hypothetical protein
MAWEPASNGVQVIAVSIQYDGNRRDLASIHDEEPM